MLSTTRVLASLPLLLLLKFDTSDGCLDSCVSCDMVSMQLKWVLQAQFAGYVAGDRRGYYADECIALQIRPGGPAIDGPLEVHDGRADVGIVWVTQYLMSDSAVATTKMIAPIFRRAGFRQISWKNAGLDYTRPETLKGKKVGYWSGGNEGNVLAYLEAVKQTLGMENATTGEKIAFEKTGQGWGASYSANQYDFLGMPFTMEKFTKSPPDADFTSAMTYNELAMVLETKKSEGCTAEGTSCLYQPDELEILDFNENQLSDPYAPFPAFVEDTLIIAKDSGKFKDNPDLLKRFLKATAKAWAHCADDYMSCVDTFISKGAHQRWQMNEINSLIFPQHGDDKFGIMSNEAMAEQCSEAHKVGLAPKVYDVSEVYDNTVMAEVITELEGEGFDVKKSDFKKTDISFCLSATGQLEVCAAAKTIKETWVTFEDEEGAGAAVAIVVLTVFSILITVSVMAAIIAFRSKPSVKASSWRFGVLWCLGSILISSHALTMIGTPASNEDFKIVDASCSEVFDLDGWNDCEKIVSPFCSNGTFLIPVGFVWMITSCGVKLYRIFKLFENKKLKKLKITDVTLIKLWLPVVFIQAAIAVVWHALDPNFAVLVQDPKDTTTLYKQCQSFGFGSRNLIWVVLLGFYSMLCALATGYMAFVTRAVPDKFNESKELSNVTYIMLGCAAMIALVAAVAEEGRNKITAIAIMIALMPSLCTLKLFVPKFKKLKMEPTATTTIAGQAESKVGASGNVGK